MLLVAWHELDLIDVEPAEGSRIKQVRKTKPTREDRLNVTLDYPSCDQKLCVDLKFTANLHSGVCHLDIL